MQVEFILYTADQSRAKAFYKTVLSQDPVLDVPGMTEFDLGGCKLGLMPEVGIAKIISPAMPHPADAAGIPRCELYLLVDDARPYCDRALAAGAQLVDALTPRNWGHTVAYYSDPDSHVLAFAEVTGQKFSS